MAINLNNPLYPGYYPGEPIKRKYPSGWGNRIQPSEFNADILAQQFDYLSPKLPDIPEIVKERIIDDIEVGFKANIYSQQMSPQMAESFGEEERQDVPGAGMIAADLAPWKWAQDPQKMLNKTLGSWKKSVTDLSEIDGRVRGNMWSGLVYGEPLKEHLFQEGAQRNLFRSTYKKAEGHFYHGAIPANPLKVTDLVFDAKGTDLGSEFAKAVVIFQETRGAVPIRDEKYDTVISTAIKGAAEEAKRAEHTFGNTALEQYASGFRTRASVLKNFDDTKEAVDDLSKSIAKYSLENIPSGTVITKYNDLKSKMDDARRKIDAIKTNAAGNLTGLEIRQFEDAIKPFERVLDDLDKVYNKYNPTGGRLSRGQARALNRDLKAATESNFRRAGLTKGDAISGSAERAYLRYMQNELIGEEGAQLLASPRTSFIQKVRLILPRQEYDRQTEWIRELGTNIEDGKLLERYFWPRVRNKLEGYTPAYYVNNFMKRTHYWGFSVDEKALEANPRNPIYKAANAWVKYSGLYNNNFTVRMVTGTTAAGKAIYRNIKIRGGKHFEAVEQLNKWVNLNPKMVLSTERMMSAFTADPVTPLSMMPQVVRDALMRDLVDLTDELEIKRILAKNRIFWNIPTTGRKRIDAIEQTAKNILKMNLNTRTLTPADLGTLMGLSNKTDIVNFLNAKNLFDFDPVNKIKNAEEFALKFLKFKEWTNKNGVKIRVDFNDPIQAKNFLEGLMKWENNPDSLGIGITKAYRGWLGKIGQVLNKTQTKILNTVVGKSLAAVMNLKNRIADAFAEVFYGALSTVSGGLANLLRPFKFLIRWVGVKIIDTFQKISGAIFSGKFDDLDKILEKSVMATIKIVGCCAIGPSIGCAAMAVLVFMVILGAVPPYNPAKISQRFTDIPPSTSVPVESPITNPTNCPTPGGILFPDRAKGASYGIQYDGTYAPRGEMYAAFGHGTDEYWVRVRETPCKYAIPGYNIAGIVAQKHAENMGVCRNQTYGTVHYGSAADFSTLHTSQNRNVYAPLISGIDSWKILAFNKSSSNGDWILLEGRYGWVVWKVLILHITMNEGILNKSITVLEPGDHIGIMYEQVYGATNNTHIHMELAIGGIVRRPEKYFCL